MQLLFYDHIHSGLKVCSGMCVAVEIGIDRDRWGKSVKAVNRIGDDPTVVDDDDMIFRKGSFLYHVGCFSF